MKLRRGHSLPGRWLVFSIVPCIFFLFNSCTFLYLPPVLPAQEVRPVLELSGSKGLSLRGGVLELSVLLSVIPEEGWLAVQWYSPENLEVASDSQWITPEDAGFSLTYGLPGRIALTPGDWRAVVSFKNSFIRQFSFAVAEK